MHASYKANQQPILALLKSLNERGVVPKQRMHYWRNPDYNTSNPRRSHKSVFEKNGCTGHDIYTHLHFLPYLRYFLFGADLPDAVVAQFETKLEELSGNPDEVTSGDYEPLSKRARSLVRQHRLDRTTAAEEFFKLCLDIGLGLMLARYVRRAVMRIRLDSGARGA